MIVGSASLHHHPSHGPVPRPSTSPVPNMFAASVNGAGRKAAGGSRSHVQQAAVRLRPLPPATQRGAAFGGGSLMMIEGRTTGEEVERTAVERRESAAPAAADEAAPLARSGARNGRATPSDAEADRLKQRNRKLEADLKKALDQAKKRQAEVSELQGAAKDIRAQLVQAEKDAEAARDRLRKSEASSSDALRRERDAAAALRKELDEAKAAAQRTLEASALASSQQRDAASKEAAETERRLRAELESAKADAVNQRKRADLLQGQLDSTRSELTQAVRRATEESARADAERTARQQSDATHLAKLGQLEREAAEAKQELALWRERIGQVDSFVLEICQPQFTVVKDDSLAPMPPEARASGGKEGFVLVPLHLLLQGYALLPGDKKQSIAQRYEASRAGGK